MRTFFGILWYLREAARATAARAQIRAWNDAASGEAAARVAFGMHGACDSGAPPLGRFVVRRTNARRFPPADMRAD